MVSGDSLRNLARLDSTASSASGALTEALLDGVLAAGSLSVGRCILTGRVSSKIDQPRGFV